MGDSKAINGFDLGDSPKTLVAALGAASLRQYAHLVALADRALRQLDCFGLVALEVQPEGPSRRQDLDLCLKVCAELEVLGLDLTQELGQS